MEEEMEKDLLEEMLTEEGMEVEDVPDCHYRDRSSLLPFARGGPIFVPDLVSPFTSVHQFLSSTLHHLYDLEAELDTNGEHEDDLSAGELRVLTEEELMEKAIEEEDSEDAWGAAVPSPSEECRNGDVAEGSSISGKEIVEVNGCSFDSSSAAVDFSIMACDKDDSDKKLQRKKRKGRVGKRGRVFDRENRAAQLEGSYFTKVKELVKIKKKQDEDKLAARLHSFRSNSKPVEGAISTSEKIRRMRSLRFISSVKVKPSACKEHVPLCSPEAVLCVEIYHKKNTSKKTQEFLVLGSQPLSELRDNIYCLTDMLMQTAGHHDPSGYFLIENTFCNDLRDPCASDYSKPIFDWLNNCKNEAEEKWEHIMTGELKKKQKELLGNVETSNLPNFKSTNMDRIRFSDLHFRLGAGYLYCHQGNCKHIIVIRDMRLAHQDDSQNRAEYPLCTFHIRPRQRKCQVCKIFLAAKMTVDDKWAPENPCYFCIKCYFLLHYKEDGSLLYDHSVFDYYHEL